MTKRKKAREVSERVHIVSYSGGLGSFLSAWFLKEQNKKCRLVFCDTKIEDPDLYRFIDETSDLLGYELVKLADGRTPWQVFEDVKFIGNSRIAPCSRELKTKVFKKWLEANYEEGDCKIVLGFDGSEGHRIERAKKNWLPYEVVTPLEDWILTKDKATKVLMQNHIAIPRLYKFGFQHNNCGGFCVRAGTAQFRHLKRVFPDRYEQHAKAEEELLHKIKTTKPFLRKTTEGELAYMTLREFEKELETDQLDLDFGGCGCFDDSEEQPK